MKIPVLLAAAVCGQCVHADVIQNVPFSLTAPTIGSIQQTVLVPQFDPAKGALNSVTLTLNGNFQYVLEIFNTGAGPVSATVQEAFTFNGIPLPPQSTYSTTIPADQPIFNFTAPPTPFGPLTEFFSANTANFFSGTGTVPFTLSLGRPAVTQFSGPTTTGVLAFGGVSGTLTADYAFTPAAGAVPEPASLGLAGIGLAGLGLFARRRLRLRRCGCLPRYRPVQRRLRREPEKW